MAKRDRVDVDAFFSEVDQGQEVHELRDQVNTLEAKLVEKSGRETELIEEIERLKQSQGGDEPQNGSLDSAVGELRRHLEDSYGKVQFPIGDIYRNEEQPRQSFTKEVRSMERSLQVEGQLDPVILFSDGRLFDGECRWRSATNLGWDFLEAVFIPDMDGPSLRRKAYLTSLHRQSLNALDRAEALVAIVCDSTEVEAGEVPKILNRVLTRIKRQNNALSSGIELLPPNDQELELERLQLSSEEKAVFLVLLGLQENPTSLSRNIFPMLSFQDELRLAVRREGLPCPQALVLNRISVNNRKLKISTGKAKKLLLKGVKAVLDDSLSIAQTKKWVKDELAQFLLAKDNDKLDNQSQIDPILERMTVLAKRLGGSDTDDRIAEKLASIEAILSEIEAF